MVGPGQAAPVGLVRDATRCSGPGPVRDPTRQHQAGRPSGLYIHSLPPSPCAPRPRPSSSARLLSVRLLLCEPPLPALRLLFPQPPVSASADERLPGAGNWSANRPAGFVGRPLRAGFAGRLHAGRICAGRLRSGRLRAGRLRTGLTLYPWAAVRPPISPTPAFRPISASRFRSSLRGAISASLHFADASRIQRFRCR